MLHVVAMYICILSQQCTTMSALCEASPPADRRSVPVQLLLFDETPVDSSCMLVTYEYTSTRREKLPQQFRDNHSTPLQLLLPTAICSHCPSCSCSTACQPQSRASADASLTCRPPPEIAVSPSDYENPYCRRVPSLGKDWLLPHSKNYAPCR
jgi:hypothetical protein